MTSSFNNFNWYSRHWNVKKVVPRMQWNSQVISDWRMGKANPILLNGIIFLTFREMRGLIGVFRRKFLVSTPRLPEMSEKTLKRIFKNWKLWKERWAYSNERSKIWVRQEGLLNKYRLRLVFRSLIKVLERILISIIIDTI